VGLSNSDRYLEIDETVSSSSSFFFRSVAPLSEHGWISENEILHEGSTHVSCLSQDAGHPRHETPLYVCMYVGPRMYVKSKGKTKRRVRARPEKTRIMKSAACLIRLLPAVMVRGLATVHYNL